MGQAILLQICSSVAAEPAASSPATAAQVTAAIDRELDQPLKVHGVVFESGKPLASVVNQITGRTGWVVENEVIGDYLVKTITLREVVFVDRQSRQELVVVVSPARFVENQPEGHAGSPLKYSRAWINSHENPMLMGSHPLPLQVIRNWSRMSPEERQQIIDYYLAHGWRLIGVEADSNGIAHTFIWENVYEEERKSAIMENRRRFMANLSEGQSAAWETINRNPSIPITGGQLTPQLQAIIAERRKAVDAFRQSLQADQRAAMDSMNDFTKAQW